MVQERKLISVRRRSESDRCKAQGIVATEIKSGAGSDLAAVRSPNGSGAAAALPAATSSSRSSAASVTQAFAQLTGQTQSQQQGGAAPASLADLQLAGVGALAGLGDYMDAVANANDKSGQAE
jgi:hypothetical protein